MPLRTLSRFLILTVALVTLVGCASPPTRSPTAPSPTVSRPSPTNVPAAAATTAPASAPTSGPTPILGTSPTTNPTTITVATSTPASTPAAQRVTSRYQLTAADSGKTFTYPITSRFGIVLNQTSYPRADLKVACVPANTLGPISNLPSVPASDYAVRYEGVTPGTCTISDRGFVVHVQIVPMAPADEASPIPGSTATISQPIPPGTGIGGTPPYLDERSSGEALVQSYYNAINRHEFDRAYSYWEPAAAQKQIPPYTQFKAGYAQTASVDLTIGKTTVSPGAGQLYFKVPVALVSHQTDGQAQAFVGCYTLHLAQPVIQDKPPFQPMEIQSASVKQVANEAAATASLGQACQ